MTQKVIQIGNSTGIIIPKSLLEKLGIKPGEEVYLDEDVTAKTLTISTDKQRPKQTSITPEFLAILERVNKNYGHALKILAEK